MGAIEVDGLTKRYGEVVAVDGLDLSVESGELFGLLGPNGAGKSTLINVLCTLLEPTAGSATVAGHDVRDAPGSVRERIGVVFQEPALDEELTGAENLAFHGRLYGMRDPRRGERIEEVLDLVDLSDREVGFLKEILVAPVPRTSVVLGRIAGGATTGFLQSGLVLSGTLLVGFRPVSIPGLLLAALFLVGLSTAFIGFGLALAAGFRDTQGYSLVVNFVLFPLAFLSGAFYPLSNLPAAIRWVGYLNPLTYGIDGLRGALVGSGAATYPLWVDAAAVALAGAVTVLVGAWLFDRVEAA